MYRNMYIIFDRFFFGVEKQVGKKDILYFCG